MISGPATNGFEKVAVLGAGVMGTQIAAHFANAGIPCLLLDIVPTQNVIPSASEGSAVQKQIPHVVRNDMNPRSRIARESIQRLEQLKPAPLFLPELSDLITPGNFEDDLGKLSEVDWVVEAVIEVLEIKRDLLRKVEGVVRPGTLVSTNTSGIRIAQIADGFSNDFRQHFLGTHFFNPPRYMKLLELIPTPQTLPAVVDRISKISTEILGKSVIQSNDTPNFIANRLGTFMVSYILHLMLEEDYTIEEIDQLTGRLTGKPKSATFRTLDLVGIDTFVQVAKNLYEALPQDEMRSTFKVPDLLTRMVEKKMLGEKSGQGFYKRVRREDGQSEILVLDLKTLEYRPRRKAGIPSVEMAQGLESLQERLQFLLSAKDKGGDFVRKTTSAMLAYASNRIPEISDSLFDLDCAMRWGYYWEAGPFGLGDMIGLETSIQLVEKEGFQMAPWVLRLFADGKKRFYQERDGEMCYYSVEKLDYLPAPSDPNAINLARLKENRAFVIAENEGASLVDLGDRILCVEFHTKMNAIGDDILKMANAGLDALGQSYDAMVIGNHAENFSVGANLMLILMLAEEEEWDEIAGAVRRFQDLNMRMKYSPRPVVAAPRGRALGGGCEIVMHAGAVCASVESYLGLVELGAGVIPAGGGIKEMVCRAFEHGKTVKPAEGLPVAFQTIAFSKVSSSAMEAKKLGYLRNNTSFVMNSDHVLFEAKQLALSLAKKGYKAPVYSKPMGMGKALYDKLAAGIEQMREAARITEYDAHLAKKLAMVMSGGDKALSEESTEQHFLDLERETFLSLCGEKKTRERMQHLLKTGKPLRN